MSSAGAGFRESMGALALAEDGASPSPRVRHSVVVRSVRSGNSRHPVSSRVLDIDDGSARAAALGVQQGNRSRINLKMVDGTAGWQGARASPRAG